MNKQDAYFTILFVLTDPEWLQTHSDLSIEQIQTMQNEAAGKMGIPAGIKKYKAVPESEIKKYLSVWFKKEISEKINFN